MEINGYVFDEALDYSMTYYWRVKAITADVTSSWVMGMFTTMAEPVVEEPITIIVELEYLV